jgi:hypothetical protein
MMARRSFGHWEIVVSEPKHYLMIAGTRSEAEKGVGSIREYEIAREPG